MTDKDFQKGLADLKNGEFSNSAGLKLYADDCLSALRDLLDAALECAVKQAQQLKIVRGLNGQLEETVRRKNEENRSLREQLQAYQDRGAAQ